MADTVNELGTMLWSMKGWLIVGAVIMAAGGVVLWTNRQAGPEALRTARWIGIPLLGCGGCLFAYPFIALFGLVLMYYGVMAFCGQTTGC
jgi:hypothetical protein